jgi:hypothetical protein
MGPKDSSGGVRIGDVDKFVPEDEDEESDGGADAGEETPGIALSIALMLYSPKSKNVEAIIGQSCWHISTVRRPVWR